MKPLKKIIALIALGTSLLISANSQASLIGDTIDITLAGAIELQDIGILVDNDVEIVGGDASTDFGGFLFPSEFIDIGDTSISMQFDLPLGENGLLTFSDLDFGTGIVDVLLTSSIPIVNQSNVSFTSSSITLDFADWFFEGGTGSFTLDLSQAVAPEPVSAPSFILLFSLIMTGLFVSRRKTK
jgi:hypothetical protein